MFRLWLISKLLGGENMVLVCVTLIVNGYKTFEQCPTNLQSEIKATLLVMGLGENGKPVLE